MRSSISEEKWIKNAEDLSKVKINYFEECSKLQTKIMHNYDDKNQEEYYEIHKEFKTFVDLYQSKSIVYYSKIESIKSQLLDKANKKLLVYGKLNSQKFIKKLSKIFLKKTRT